MKNTKEKLINQSKVVKASFQHQSKVVKASFQQVDIALSLSITQTCQKQKDKLGSAFVHSNIYRQ